jgi:transposase
MMHRVCDKVNTQHGQGVQKWFVKHPHFIVHFTPVYCSWMSQVEPWSSILQRKRLRLVDIDLKDHLRAKIEPFIHE